MPLVIPNIFVDGTIADANAVNEDFSAVASYINGISIPTTPVSVANGGTGASSVGGLTGAATVLGLADTGLFLPATASYAGGTLSLSTGSGNAAVTAYSLGVGYAFNAPSSITGTIYVQDSTNGTLSLGAKLLYDGPASGAATPTAALASGQLCYVAYSPPVGGFVLVNPPPPANAVREQEFSTPGTYSFVVPNAITTM